MDFSPPSDHFLLLMASPPEHFPKRRQQQQKGFRQSKASHNLKGKSKKFKQYCNKYDLIFVFLHALYFIFKQTL